MTHVEGIDAYEGQGAIDWRAVRNAGKRFAIVKATEGTGHVDGQFAANWRAAEAVGMVRAAYHYCLPALGSDEQVNFLHSVVKGAGGFRYGDGLVPDLEVTQGLDAAQLLQWLIDFCAKARADIAKQILIYTAPWFWVGILGDPAPPQLADYPLWMADYGSSVPTFKLWPQGLSIWQYSDTGHCPGVAGEVDLDRFYGGFHQLQRLMRPGYAR